MKTLHQTRFTDARKSQSRKWFDGRGIWLRDLRQTGEVGCTRIVPLLSSES